jgi:hypothetical protein
LLCWSYAGPCAPSLRAQGSHTRAGAEDPHTDAQSRGKSHAQAGSTQEPEQAMPPTTCSPAESYPAQALAQPSLILPPAQTPTQTPAQVPDTQTPPAPLSPHADNPLMQVPQTDSELREELVKEKEKLFSSRPATYPTPPSPPKHASFTHPLSPPPPPPSPSQSDLHLSDSEATLRAIKEARRAHLEEELRWAQQAIRNRKEHLKLMKRMRKSNI